MSLSNVGFWIFELPALCVKFELCDKGRDSLLMGKRLLGNMFLYYVHLGLSISSILSVKTEQNSKLTVVKDEYSPFHYPPMDDCYYYKNHRHFLVASHCSGFCFIVLGQHLLPFYSGEPIFLVYFMNIGKKSRINMSGIVLKM